MQQKKNTLLHKTLITNHNPCQHLCMIRAGVSQTLMHSNNVSAARSILMENNGDWEQTQQNKCIWERPLDAHNQWGILNTCSFLIHPFRLSSVKARASFMQDNVLLCNMHSDCSNVNTAIRMIQDKVLATEETYTMRYYCKRQFSK